MIKTVYISGSIERDPDYFKKFERAEEELKAAGYTALNPAKLPEGMSKEQYMQINIAQLFAADAVLLLPGWELSHGANIECSLSIYIGKPFATKVGDLDGKNNM